MLPLLAPARPVRPPPGRHRHPPGPDPRAALGALAELAAPLVCAGCGTPGHGLCPRCTASAPWFDAGPRPVPTRAGLPVVAAGAYAGVLARVLHAYKDGERRDLDVVLAPGLLAAVGAALAAVLGPGEACSRVVLVPAPSSARTTRRRGDSPTLRLARLAARASTGPVRLDVVPALAPRRAVADQSTLGREGRARNVAQAYAVRSPGWRERCAGAPVLLVDDVVTTGATLRECARALDAGGLDVRAAACAVATPAPRDRDARGRASDRSARAGAARGARDPDGGRRTPGGLSRTHGEGSTVQ